jgi:hypothetical protein
MLGSANSSLFLDGFVAPDCIEMRRPEKKSTDAVRQFPVAASSVVEPPLRLQASELKGPCREWTIAHR